jgi:hypothetical protein
VPAPLAKASHRADPLKANIANIGPMLVCHGRAIVAAIDAAFEEPILDVPELRDGTHEDGKGHQITNCSCYGLN